MFHPHAVGSRAGLGVVVLLRLQVALAAEPAANSAGAQPTFTCEDVSVHEVKPAGLEWSQWVSGGAAFERRRSPSALGSIGFELTRQALAYRGFPAGPRGWLSTAELRAGPWVTLSTGMRGGAVEGGLDLKAGGVFSGAWGSWDLRLGTGYGAFARDREPLLSATVLWGVRSVRRRYSRHLACLPAAPAASVAEASVIRLFVGVRAGLDHSDARELVAGVELSPSMLLPPYSWFRFVGAEP
jgi:hypothetical protein